MPSKTTRLKLIKKNKSIAKVIFVQKEDAFDIKLCIPCSNYYIKGYKLLDEKPIADEVIKDNNIEIEVSYHSKKGDLDPKIHFKIINNGGVTYKTLPLTRLSSPTADSFVPFPLFKIEIPDTCLELFEDAKASHKKEYQEHIINNDHKIVEVYLLSKDSKALERYSPYNELLTYFLTCNFECFCTNKIDGKKTPFFFKDRDYPSVRDMETMDISNFRVIVMTTIFPSLEKLIDKPTVTFVENELSDAIFYHSLIKEHGYAIEPGHLLVGNMSDEALLNIDTDNIEKYWQKESLSYLLYRGTRDSEERAIIKKNALEYLEMLKVEVMKKETITLYEPRGIMIATDALKMTNELAQKLITDMFILEKNNTKENQIAFRKNEYMFYWLKFDYYNMLSETASINKLDVENGWFIWLKIYNVSMPGPFQDKNEENTAIYDKYFDMFMQPLYKAGKQVNEAIECYKNQKYFACACVIFSCLEKVERSITNFNPSEHFSMSRQLKIPQADAVVCFNKEYFISFEKQMNDFLINNFYAKSLESNPEPKEINRNRIMHGIFTREVSKTDCLKLFVLLNSLIRFDDWLNCFRQMKEISLFLNNNN